MGNPCTKPLRNHGPQARMMSLAPPEFALLIITLIGMRYPLIGNLNYMLNPHMDYYSKKMLYGTDGESFGASTSRIGHQSLS